MVTKTKTTIGVREVDARAALDIAGWKKVVDCKARQEGNALLTKNWPSRCVGMNYFNLNLPKPDEHQKMIHEASNRDVVLNCGPPI